MKPEGGVMEFLLEFELEPHPDDALSGRPRAAFGPVDLSGG
jgi:hypothetical protein